MTLDNSSMHFRSDPLENRLVRQEKQAAMVLMLLIVTVTIAFALVIGWTSPD